MSSRKPLETTILLDIDVTTNPPTEQSMKMIEREFADEAVKLLLRLERQYVQDSGFTTMLSEDVAAFRAKWGLE